MKREPILIARASSWPKLFDCAHKFFWEDVYGLRMPSGGRSALGTAVHAGTAHYDKAVLAGEPADVLESVDQARERIARPDDEVVWDEDLPRSAADQLAVTLTTKYCHTIAPTHRYDAVEVRCASLDIETQHGIVRVTGTTDRVRRLADGRRGISDIKTGARATTLDGRGRRQAATKSHFMQLGVYTLMAEQELQEELDGPAEIIALQTTKETPIGTADLPDVKSRLLGTEEHPGLIEMAAGIAKSGSFLPNPSSFLCSAKYCAAHALGRCRYHD